MLFSLALIDCCLSKAFSDTYKSILLSPSFLSSSSWLIKAPNATPMMTGMEKDVSGSGSSESEKDDEKKTLGDAAIR